MNIRELTRGMDLAGCGMRHDVIVSDEMFNSLKMPNPLAIEGYKFTLKKRISIIQEISKLPEYVYFEGGTFQILIFPKKESECGICYQCLSFEETSKHKKQWDEYGCWENPLLDGHTCSFLYLRESIETDEELIEALQGALKFLTDNKLYEPTNTPII